MAVPNCDHIYEIKSPATTQTVDYFPKMTLELSNLSESNWNVNDIITRNSNSGTAKITNIQDFAIIINIGGTLNPGDIIQFKNGAINLLTATINFVLDGTHFVVSGLSAPSPNLFGVDNFVNITNSTTGIVANFICLFDIIVTANRWDYGVGETITNTTTGNTSLSYGRQYYPFSAANPLTSSSGGHATITGDSGDGQVPATLTVTTVTGTFLDTDILGNGGNGEGVENGDIHITASTITLKAYTDNNNATTTINVPVTSFDGFTEALQAINPAFTTVNYTSLWTGNLLKNTPVYYTSFIVDYGEGDVIINAIAVNCTQPAPAPTPIAQSNSGAIRKNLIRQSENEVVELGCKEIRWAKIGKPIAELRKRRVVYLNALFLLGLGVSESEVRIIDCYIQLNNQ